MENTPQAAATETATTPAATTAAPTAPAKASKPKAAKKASPKKPAAKKLAKAPKKVKKAAKPGEDSTQALVAARKQYTVDKKHKTAAGNPSVHNGDKVAKALLGKTLDEVYKAAAAALKEPESALRAKYKHLNAGMQRMNLGNRMRAA